MNTVAKVRATLVKRTYDSRTFARLPDEEVEIEADGEDQLMALFFREYDNRYKYCNTLSFAFQDPDLRSRYVAWISDIANYARHGGDMW